MITIPIRRLITGLALTALVLCLLSIGLKALEWELGANTNYWVYRLNELFSVNQEGNIPTFYSALLLLGTALTCAAVAFTAETRRRIWGLLALLLLYLSVDEASGIHEIFTTPMQETFQLEGYLYFGWLLIGIPAALLVGGLFLPFVLKLPSRTRLHLIAGAALYLFGAVIVEAISANEWNRFGGPSLLFSAIGALEEYCEMSGVILVLRGLLLHLREQTQQISIRLANTAG